MRKLMYLLFVVLLGVILQAAESLKVDFNGNNWGEVIEDTMTGFEPYNARNEVLADFIPTDYTVFGTTVTITPTWAVGTNNEAMQSFWRPNEPASNPAYVEDEANMFFLVRDWIGTDTRDAKGLEDPMTLTISGLPRGFYVWKSYHHDTGTTVTIGTFDVTVNDGFGSATTTDIQGTSNGTVGTIDGVATFETSIYSNGTDDVSLVFDLHTTTNPYNEAWFVLNGFELALDVVPGQATDPVPGVSLDPEVDSQATTELSWTGPADANILSIGGYDVVFGTEPNMLLNSAYDVGTSTSLELDGVGGNPGPLDFSTSYYWRVDTHLVWDSNEITGVIDDIVEGQSWYFTTFADDLIPVVTVADVLTAMELLPATLTGTVNDLGENDVNSISWDFLGTTAVAAAMQMITRGNDLSAVTADPNLLMDWIGTDTRQVGNPLYLTLKGLPSGTYDWLSYHHDAENQTGVFDVTVYDDSGTTVTTDIAYRNGNSLPVITVPLTITSNGTDDVVLAFDLHEEDMFFLMNGFDLDTTGGSVAPLYIDFGSDPNNLMSGYQEYLASHENAASFTEQSYSAFSTTVSILPTWAGVPGSVTVTDITNDPDSASQTATLDTDYPGEYLVQLSATDDASQTGLDTAVVKIAANVCLAAQESGSWNGFNTYDLDQDCDVDIDDLVTFVNQWLDDRNLTGQE